MVTVDAELDINVGAIEVTDEELTQLEDIEHNMETSLRLDITIEEDQFVHCIESQYWTQSQTSINGEQDHQHSVAQTLEIRGNNTSDHE